MVVTECNFDPVKDLKAVEQFGFVDLKEAWVNRCVPSQVGESDADYNGIDNPASILGMPSDVFDALDMVEYVEKAESENKTDE